jgi:hypothetical protein
MSLTHLTFSRRRESASTPSGAPLRSVSPSPSHVSPVPMNASAETVLRRRTPTVLRWLSLIEMHGGHTAALEALIRQSDELLRLKCAVRELGYSPEVLAALQSIDRC